MNTSTALTLWSPPRFVLPAALLDAEGGYRPSLGCTDPAKVGPLSVLADAYDASQGERGDPRRAMRWGAMAAVAGKEGVS